MFNGTGIEQFTLLGKLDCSQLGFLRGKNSQVNRGSHALEWSALSFPSVRPQLNKFPVIKTAFIKSVHVKMMMNDSLTNNQCAPHARLYLLWSASDGKVMTASARLPDS